MRSLKTDLEFSNIKKVGLYFEKNRKVLVTLILDFLNVIEWFGVPLRAKLYASKCTEEKEYEVKSVRARKRRENNWLQENFGWWTEIKKLRKEIFREMSHAM